MRPHRPEDSSLSLSRPVGLDLQFLYQESGTEQMTKKSRAEEEEAGGPVIPFKGIPPSDSRTYKKVRSVEPSASPNAAKGKEVFQYMVL